MATPFHVELVTPEAILYSGDADEVSMRTDAGEIAFLAHHEDFIGAVDITVVTIATLLGEVGAADAERPGAQLAAVHGGFVHVSGDGVKILAGVAELGDKIDIDRARLALAGAEGATAHDESRARDESVEAARDVDADTEAPLSPTFAAIADPESPDARLRRARVRLEAAGAAAPER